MFIEFALFFFKIPITCKFIYLINKYLQLLHRLYYYSKQPITCSKRPVSTNSPKPITMFKRNHLYSLLLVLFLTPFNSFSSHLMGGEITWTCDGSGNFIFRVKLYRDCNGIPGPSGINLSTNAPIGSISCALIQQNDISPVGTGCPTCSNPMGYTSATEEFIYESAPTNLNGTIPPAGWYFFYSDCCRNAAISNLATGSGIFALRATMYPSPGATSGCSDNSPQFAISPTLTLCSNDSVRYTHAAFDPDLDSLTYSWGIPLDNGYPGTPYPFN